MRRISINRQQIHQIFLVMNQIPDSTRKCWCLQHKCHQELKNFLRCTKKRRVHFLQLALFYNLALFLIRGEKTNFFEGEPYFFWLSKIYISLFYCVHFLIFYFLMYITLFFVSLPLFFHKKDQGWYSTLNMIILPWCH